MHHIHQHQNHLSWDNSIPPIIRINSGEIVTFDCLDASNVQINSQSTDEAISSLDFSKLDQVNGPIYINDAEPGDILEIEIIDIKTADWGWTGIIPGFGLLHEEFLQPKLKIWKLNENNSQYIWFKQNQIRILLRPFTGECGVAHSLNGSFSTIPPYRTGGNIDTKYLIKGAKLYLPIECKGALFSIGDGHAAQGDGEVCGTAIETPINVSVRLTIRRGDEFKHIISPCLLTSSDMKNSLQYYSVLGIADNMLEATKQAIRQMIIYLEQTKGLTREEAYMLCSIAVDIRVTQVVDMPNYTVGAFLPLDIFVNENL
jgi:acetamidase/formamidase